MNDRAISVLEQYELELQRSYKGRGSIICETDRGLLILKEFTGREERILEINPYLKALKESGFLVESFVPNKEGRYICRGHEQKNYVLKDYFEGRECLASNEEDLLCAFAFLGRLQKQLQKIGYLPMEILPEVKEESDESDEKQESVHAADTEAAAPVRSSRLLPDTQKKNRELRHIRKYLKAKGNKSPFEQYLQKTFDTFLRQAEELEKELEKTVCSGPVLLCHGDFQYHNLLLTPSGIAVINFEKMQADDASRDLATFFRKVMEKTGWDTELARRLLKSYDEEYPMTEEEYRQFLFRISYPEKFRKIVNNYMNSRKLVSFDKSREKIERLLQQEKSRQECISFLHGF